MLRNGTITRNRVTRSCVILCCLVLLALALPSTAHARVRLENICTIQGQQEQKLMGLGLVVGLKGTGDGGKHLPTIHALAAALKLMDNPLTRAEELKEVNNVALVLVEATVPANGIQRGQKIDCFVNSVGSAKSLRGGRLMVSALSSQLIADDRLMGLASGSVMVEDDRVPTSGRVSSGVVIMRDVVRLFVENNEFRLLLDGDHSSFQSASEIARVVNADISFEANGRQLAKAIGPGVVLVQVPEQYRNDPVQFVAQVLDVGIDNPHSQARVVVNSKSGTVIVTGEVEISPVVISHKNLSVSIGGDDTGTDPNGQVRMTQSIVPGGEGADPVPGVGFVPIVDQQARQSPQRLRQLVDALNQLKVPTADAIEIIKDLHRTGKLHAVLITE